MDKETPARMPANTLAFIALANEYCALLENCSDIGRQDFERSLRRLLPRIYISADDLRVSADDSFGYDDGYIAQALDEAHYETVRQNVETLMGEDDTYLDTVMEDMRYSDTPVAASISEQCADIFQPLFNFVEAVRDTTDDVVDDAVRAVADDFDHWLSATICNLLRAVNALR